MNQSGCSFGSSSQTFGLLWLYRNLHTQRCEAADLEALQDEANSADARLDKDAFTRPL